MTTQISSPCITTTDICNGSYGCGTDTEMAVLARVVPVWENDEWSIGKAYGPLSVVKAPGTDTLYISKVPVPCGIELSDPKYWSVYNDNKVASEAKEIAEEARAEAAGAVSAADAASRAVVAEAEARENADSAITTELNAKIMQEQEARETADNSINEEVSRLSSNSDALSARVDELEQNGGGGIASLETRLTAAETINTQQGTEIESLQTQLSTANDDINSMGEQLHGMVEQVDTNSVELDQLIVPGTVEENGTWKTGPELEKWLGQSLSKTEFNQAMKDGTLVTPGALAAVQQTAENANAQSAGNSYLISQLIVPIPNTQQFEKGPKMEEWTSGGGIKRFSFSKNYSKSQLVEELMTYNTPVNITLRDGQAIAGAICIQITATFTNEKTATMTKTISGVCPIIQIPLAKSVSGNGRFYFYPGNSNIPQFVNCYADFIIIKDIQNHIGIKFDKVLHGFYDDPSGNFEFVRKINITNITNVSVIGEFIYA